MKYNFIIPTEELSLKNKLAIFSIIEIDKLTKDDACIYGLLVYINKFFGSIDTATGIRYKTYPWYDKEKLSYSEYTKDKIYKLTVEQVKEFLEMYYLFDISLFTYTDQLFEQNLLQGI